MGIEPTLPTSQVSVLKPVHYAQHISRFNDHRKRSIVDMFTPYLRRSYSVPAGF